HSRSALRHALHRNAARHAGDQAQHARAGAARRLQQSDHRTDQRLGRDSEDRDRASGAERPDLRAGERRRGLAGGVAGDERALLGRHLFGFLAFKLLFITRINNLVDKAIEFRMLDLHAERIADIALATPEVPTTSTGHSSSGLLHLEAKGLAFAYGAVGSGV